MLHIQMLLLILIYFLINDYVAGTTVKDMRFKLHSGDLMPAIGVGTYLINDEELITNVLDFALGAGYRNIDTATLYGNEEQIGKALKVVLPKHNLTRQDIFITTKLAPADMGNLTHSGLQRSLKKLDCDYIDLYLIHLPGPYDVPTTYEENSKLRDESWRQLVQEVKDGLVRNIGISNYKINQIEDLLANDHGIKPAVHQNEWNPFFHPKDMKEFCDKQGILFEAYSSLGGTGNTVLLDHPQVKQIAQKLGKSPAQVLLKWTLQQNIPIIPKASSRERIEENIQLDFTLSGEDMESLSGFPEKKLIMDVRFIP